MPKVHTAAKVDVKLQRKYKRKAWDPTFPFLKKHPSPSTLKKDSSQEEEEEYNNVISTDLQEYVNHSIKKLNPGMPLDEQNAEMIKNLSLQLMDRVFNAMANPVPPIPSLVQEPLEKRKITIKNREARFAHEEDYFRSTAANKSVLDWEFMLSNVIQAKLPPM